MENTETYEKLKELFVADLMAKIIPGAIHNLANPLGGIMGRVQLMQARIANGFSRIEARHPELYKEFALEKIVRDVEILSVESETLLGMFRNFEGKILTFSQTGSEVIDVVELIESEIKFADFYLDFKHGVNKTKKFNDDVPAVALDRAGFALCISALINSARQRMQATTDKVFSASVDYDDKEVIIVFQDSGEPIVNGCGSLSDAADFVPDMTNVPMSERCLCYALMLLNHYGFKIGVEVSPGVNAVSVHIPYATVSR
jgi:signal transduction histidine kinase